MMSGKGPSALTTSIDHRIEPMAYIWTMSKAGPRSPVAGSHYGAESTIGYTVGTDCDLVIEHNPKSADMFCKAQSLVFGTTFEIYANGLSNTVLYRAKKGTKVDIYDALAFNTFLHKETGTTKADIVSKFKALPQAQYDLLWYIARCVYTESQGSQGEDFWDEKAKAWMVADNKRQKTFDTDFLPALKQGLLYFIEAYKSLIDGKNLTVRSANGADVAIIEVRVLH
jgi:septum formation topological specificity factor MinE